MTTSQVPATQAATEQPAVTSGQAPATTVPAQSTTTVDPSERLRIVEQELKEARAEAARYRKRNDDETSAKLKEQGDFKALYEKAAPDLEKAKRYDAHVERLKAKLDTETASLPTYLQKAVAAAPDIEAAVEIVDEWRKANASTSTQTTTTKDPASAATAAPAATPPPTRDLLSMSEKEFETFKQSDPEGFAKALRGIGVMSAPVPSTARYQKR